MAKNNDFNQVLRDLEHVQRETTDIIQADPNIMGRVARTTNPNEITFTDYRNVLESTNTSIRPIVEGMCMSFVTKDNMLDERVQQRINIDCIALSDIIWKKTITDLALIKIMERIETGDDDAKLFAAFASVVSTKNNMAKELLQTIMVFEKNYRELKSDLFEQKRIPVDDSDGVSADAIKYRGSRQLLQAVKNAKEYEKTKQQLIKEIEAIEEEEEVVDVLRPARPVIEEKPTDNTPSSTPDELSAQDPL